MQAMQIEERPRVGHFAAILFETMWRIHNEIRLGGTAPEWDKLSQVVNHSTDKY